jgi:hypothetical protein
MSAQDSAEMKGDALLELLLLTNRKCPICWAIRHKTETHWAYHCPEKRCGLDATWLAFKGALIFPSGIVCNLCAVPYQSPCLHARPPGKCQFPDHVKEFAFLIYTEAQFRDAAFAKLGIAVPKNVLRYAHWLGQANTSDGVLHITEIVGVFAELRAKGAI